MAALDGMTHRYSEIQALMRNTHSGMYYDADSHGEG